MYRRAFENQDNDEYLEPVTAQSTVVPEFLTHPWLDSATLQPNFIGIPVRPPEDHGTQDTAQWSYEPDLAEEWNGPSDRSAKAGTRSSQTPQTTAAMASEDCVGNWPSSAACNAPGFPFEDRILPSFDSAWTAMPVSTSNEVAPWATDWNHVFEPINVHSSLEDTEGDIFDAAASIKPASLGLPFETSHANQHGRRFAGATHDFEHLVPSNRSLESGNRDTSPVLYTSLGEDLDFESFRFLESVSAKAYHDENVPSHRSTSSIGAKPSARSRAMRDKHQRKETNTVRSLKAANRSSSGKADDVPRITPMEPACVSPRALLQAEPTTLPSLGIEVNKQRDPPPDQLASQSQLSQEMGCAKTKALKRPADRDWQRHREKIIRLYVQEHLPLEKVRKIMEDNHGFDARYESLGPKLITIV